MAFTLTAFKAYGRYIDEPITTRCHQVVVMDYARSLSSDTAADFGDFTAGSTFWGSATGDATYGALAIAARAVMQKISAKAQALECAFLTGDSGILTQAVAATAVTNYALVNTGTYPAIAVSVTHYAGTNGNPLKVRAVFEWVNKAEERAERYGV
jgi:hypothetical protein